MFNVEKLFTDIIGNYRHHKKSKSQVSFKIISTKVNTRVKKFKKKKKKKTVRWFDLDP